MHHWILNHNIAREREQKNVNIANYEFMFIPSDIKNGENMGRFDNHG